MRLSRTDYGIISGSIGMLFGMMPVTSFCIDLLMAFVAVSCIVKLADWVMDS